MILEADGYITLQQIANKVEVSTRTLLRELHGVQYWVEQHDGGFDKKKGKGLLIRGDDQEKQRLQILINKEKSDIIYTPHERGIILRAEMLRYNEPIKLFTLAHLLDVTESTIANDLIQLEPWFNDFGIKVLRRPGLGTLLHGDEKLKRKAIVALIYEYISFIEFLDYIKGNKLETVNVDPIKARINGSIYNLLELNKIKQIRELLNTIETDMGYHFADNAFVALTIRMSVTIKREIMWGQSLIAYDYKENIRRDKIYTIITKWRANNLDSPFVKMPEEELLYLTMHIKGAKLRETTQDNRISMIEDFKTIQLVKEFIAAVENEMGIYLADNEALMVGLVKHLRPALYRMKMELDIINPLLSEIKAMYPKLFIAIRKCTKVIEERERVVVPEDEVAYLATHIGAVIQKEYREIVKRYQVVLACMYGIGASQLLVANIEKNFKNIDIVKVISVMDYKTQIIDFKDVDLVISTVGIEDVKVPIIVVNPIFRQEDIVRITDFLKAFTPNKSYIKSRRKGHLKEKLEILDQYSHIIKDILKYYSYEKDVMASTMNDVIAYASQKIAINTIERKALVKSFEVREEKGSTILSKKGMVLLHCRADISKQICLKILRLSEAIEIEQNNRSLPVSVVVVMVGPVLINQKVLNVLSEVSRCIITSEFSDIIIGNDEGEIEAELNRILDKYYENQVISL